jgi:DsbC/DsbD-like thiol-disulfide interchange protein
MSTMRAPLLTAAITCLSLVLSVSGQAQSLLARPTAQHATVHASSATTTTAAGSAVLLWADVTPDPSIHIYAAGAKEFTPVSIVLTPNASIVAGKARYPKPDGAPVPGASDPPPVYERPFRITVPVTISSKARPGETVTIAGAVNYQACDDRLCYPVAVAPVTWKIAVK